MDKEKPLLDVPSQICERFLEDLKSEGMEEELIKKLRKTILSDGLLTETAIRAAISDSESTA